LDPDLHGSAFILVGCIQIQEGRNDYKNKKVSGFEVLDVLFVDECRLLLHFGLSWGLGIKK
jgi:hypothetical protein